MATATVPAPGIVVDLFAGGGGASTGIATAIGRDPEIAINHDADAIAMHEVNHPDSAHYQEDIWAVDPAEVVAGRRVSLLWASPDCKHFSKAKGGKPRDKNIRALAWVVVKWAAAVRPDVIMLENVEEFETWGPLDAEGNVVKEKKGFTFRQWLGRLKALGYTVEKRQLRAHDYGAPTIRKRLFIIARRDELPIVWPEPTHGPAASGMLAGFAARKPYRTAAECIDWTLPVPSIFERKRPLAEATMRRIARGIQRYVIEAERPFIVSLTHQGGDRIESVDEPFATVTSANRGEKALVMPYLAGVGGRAEQSPERPMDVPYHTTTAKADTALVTPTIAQVDHPEWVCRDCGGTIPAEVFSPEDEGEPRACDYCSREMVPFDTLSPGDPLWVPFLTEHANASSARVFPADEPLRTQVAQVKGGHFALVAPTLVQTGYGEREGQAPRALDIEKPLGTVVGGGSKHAMVAAFLAKHFGGNETPGADLAEPMSTVTTQDHHALVAGHVVKLYGTSQDGQPLDAPLASVTAGGQHLGHVAAFLTAYYGNERDGQALTDPARTVTAKERLALVYVAGEPYAIVDIGMRMLTPRELFRAQGFPEDYEIEHVAGRRLTKTAQIRMCGNSVCPPVAEALVRANLGVAAEQGAEAAG